MNRTRSIAAAGALLAIVLAACAPLPPPPPPPPPPGPPPSFGSMSLGWNQPGVNGPITADPSENLLWARGGNTLFGLDATTGAKTVQDAISIDGSQHFPTPTLVDHAWVLIESGSTVKAFPTPNAPPGTETAWTSPALDGFIQGRPVVVGNTVVVATENDTLYGLNLANGLKASTWPVNGVHIGTPVPQSSLPCGDIFPLGITSNPVLDNGTVYAVGEVTAPSPANAAHEIVGVNPATGAETLAPTSIDPPTMNPTVTQQQRAGLIAANGNIYVGFGGLAGDCGIYHGWVASYHESDGTIASLEVTSNTRAGAVWATAGEAVDGSGNVYASTGNATQGTSDPTDYSDGVVKVTPTLSGATTIPADYFQPTEWRSDNSVDADLGSAAPVLVENGTQLFIIGKQHNAFLLNINSLGGTNHETPAARLNNACNGEAFGQNAAILASAYIACSNGMQQVKLS